MDKQHKPHNPFFSVCLSAMLNSVLCIVLRAEREQKRKGEVEDYFRLRNSFALLKSVTYSKPASMNYVSLFLFQIGIKTILKTKYN